MNIWTVIPLGTSLAYVLVFALAIQKIEKRVNRAFVYYLGLAAFWSFNSFVVRMQTAPEHALFWNRLLAVALIAALVAYFHFARLYTGRPAGRGVTWGYITVIGLVVMSVASDWVIESSYVEGGIIYHNFGPAIYVIGALSLFYALSVLFMLGQKYRDSYDPVEHNRTAYLLAGWSIMAPLAYTNLIPALKGLPLDHVGSFINVAIIAYAITRYDLLDIRLIARRGLGLFIMAVFLLCIYAGIVVGVSRILPDVSQAAVYSAAALIVVLVAVVARPVRNQVEIAIDRLFYRRTYDYRRLLADFCRNMGGNLNLEELANELLPMLSNAINISRSYLLLRDAEKGTFNAKYCHPKALQKDDDAEIIFDPDSPIINWLDLYNNHLTIEKIDKLPQFKALWEDEREKLDQMKIEIIFPLKSRGKLIAVLALGAKNKGRKYLTEDISMVSGITNEAGTIIENAQLYAFAIVKASTDELTGLYNHRHFHERLEEEIARGSRFGSYFSIIMVDIDLFKVYNDIYGHLAGDQVLRKVGKYIASCIRNFDLAFRYGGEEFFIILPETSKEEAYKVAERIRKTIEAKTSIRAMPITVSVGIANWPSDGVMREEIIRAADAALYCAKNSGRNRTSLFSSSAIDGKETLLNGTTKQSGSISIIYALAATVDAKDSYTYGHSRKVSEYAIRIAEDMKLPEEQINNIRTAGLLHDIGKIGIPDSILNKQASLTLAEWGPIKTHPEIGVEILRHVIELENCLPLILHHHERFDGKGYPSGLIGDSIPLGARILTIADSYDAMTTPRPYRGRMSCEDALCELQKHSGTQFDPELVERFCCIVKAAKQENTAI